MINHCWANLLQPLEQKRDVNGKSENILQLQKSSTLNRINNTSRCMSRSELLLFHIVCTYIAGHTQFKDILLVNYILKEHSSEYIL